MFNILGCFFLVSGISLLLFSEMYSTKIRCLLLSSLGLLLVFLHKGFIVKIVLLVTLLLFSFMAFSFLKDKSGEDCE